MISLILTVLCSTAIALIIKHNAVNSGQEIWLLSGNYFVAGLISLFLFVTDDSSAASVQSTVFGVILGALFIASFFAFAKAVDTSGTALATVASRLSVIIPVLLSMLVFSEIPSTFQFFGILFTLLTVWLFYISMREKNGSASRRHYAYLLIVLVGIGVNDFSMKIFQVWRAEPEKNYFMFCIFSSAFFYSIAYARLKNLRLQLSAFRRGLVLGVPNMGSTYFLLGALNVIPAVIVYPVVNIGIIILTSVAAYLFWTEKMNKFGWWALAAGIVSIGLLSV